MRKYILIIGLFCTIWLNHQLWAQWDQLAVPVNGIWSILEVEGNLFAGTSSGIYKSTDEGFNWILLSNGISTNSRINDMIYKDGYVFAALRNFGVFRSSDDGESWQQMNSGIGSDTLSVNIFHIHNGTLFIGTGHVSTLFRSTNNGLSWEVSNSGIVDPFETESFASVGSLLFAGVHTVNGTNSSTYKSTDNGTNWISMTMNTIGEGEPLLGVSSYLIGDFPQGFFRTSTFDTSWTLIENGLPSSYMITDIVNDPEFIYACESGEGVYRTPDFGDNWEDMSSGLMQFMSLLTLYRGNNYLYLGTMSDNLWRYPLSPLGVKDNSSGISNFYLNQNYPNPFNPSTKIRFTISELRLTTLKVYDILGNEVATLVNEEKPAGTYEIEFDAGNLSSGMYFYQVKTGNSSETKKMLLLR